MGIWDFQSCRIRECPYCCARPGAQYGSLSSICRSRCGRAWGRETFGEHYLRSFHVKLAFKNLLPTKTTSFTTSRPSIQHPSTSARDQLWQRQEQEFGHVEPRRRVLSIIRSPAPPFIHTHWAPFPNNGNAIRSTSSCSAKHESPRSPVSVRRRRCQRTRRGSCAVSSTMPSRLRWSTADAAAPKRFRDSTIRAR